MRVSIWSLVCRKSLLQSATKPIASEKMRKSFFSLFTMTQMSSSQQSKLKLCAETDANDTSDKS